MSARRPLVAIVGATATGKSDAAIAVAEACAGEVLSIDAYQVYRGMDIGTAKLSPEARARVPHHLIDIADPADPLTLARFLDAAHLALGGVWSRGRLPVMAGGSGQYVWALLEGWQVPRVEPDPALRSELEALAQDKGTAALVDRLAALDPEAAGRLDPGNPRRLIRAIEVVSSTGRSLAACQTRSPIDAEVLVLGLRLPREELYARLDARTDAMFAAGLVEEVQSLRAAGKGETQPVRGGVGYKEVSAYLDGDYDLAEAVRRMKNANHRLVRRQNAWFKEDDARIRWVDAGPDAATRCVEAVKAWLEAQED
ncbi:MAG TPA: tRNA (adenosine(37)-N6)-dimethylallyltransferase MiaA [Dehalococcoidia bacterium]|nr:tRNA (adenosine(37)-N6)-dimethylallyltransferase MiaA [Dehalococcoidia bacterium]